MFIILFLKVEIPKHELEHNEAAIEEDHTQFEVDMVILILITSALSLGCHGFTV